MSHDHGHADTAGRGRLAWALGIGLLLLVAQLVGAWLTGSLAILTDAVHVLTDNVGLTIAFAASLAVSQRPSDRRTWGLKRLEVIAALAQALLLVGVGAFVIVEGIRRIGEPTEVPGGLMLVFAVVGLAGNLVSLGILLGARGRSMNLRAAFLEVSADALGSVAVIVAAAVIVLTGWGPADLIAALFIGGLILPRAIRLLWDAVAVLLETTPKGLDLAEVREHLEALPDVQGVHDLHASRIASDMPVLSCHVVVDEACFREGRAPSLLCELQTCVATHFDVSVEHSTFQLEPADHQDTEHLAHA